MKITYRQLQPMLLELNALSRGTLFGFGIDRLGDDIVVHRVSRDSVLTPPTRLYAGSCREVAAFLGGVKAGLQLNGSAS